MEMNIKLNYDWDRDITEEEFDNELDGEYIAKIIGGESINELLSSIKEDAEIQLLDDMGKVIKSKRIKLDF